MIFIRLTERDIEFINDLKLVKFLNSKRIAKLYGNYTYAMKRLKQMENSGYIKVIEKNPKGENVYCVSKKIDNINIKKTNKLLHALACADFYFYMKSQHEIIKDISFEVQYYYLYNNKKYTFRPDIFIDANRKLLIEIDLSNRRFKEKVKKWEEFYISKGYHKYFNKYPPIVIVSTNTNKVKSYIDSIKTINLNYVYKNYEEIKNWKYKY